MTERVSKRSKPTTLLGLSGPLWVELILKPYIKPYVQSCIALKRTCSFFASLSAIKEWIKTFEKVMFAQFDRIHRNKLAPLDRRANMYFNQYQFFLAYRIENDSKKGTNYLGMYSSKRRLLAVFSKIICLKVLLENPHHESLFEGQYFYISIQKQNRYETLIVSNAIRGEYEQILTTYNDREGL